MDMNALGYSSTVPNVGMYANLDPRTEQLAIDTLDQFYAAGGTLPIVFESSGNINSWAVAAPYYFDFDTPKQQAVASVEHTVPVYPTLSIKSIAPVSPKPRTTAVSSINVTFSEPINTRSLTTGALILTDNGGANLINSSVTVTRLSGDTYAIGGLAALTQALGTYTFTVNAADMHSQYGSVGSGSRSTSWTMGSATAADAVIGPVPDPGSPFAVSVGLTTQPGRIAVLDTAFPVYVSTPGPASFWQSATPTPGSPDSASTTTFPGMSETLSVVTPTGEKRKSTNGWS